MSAIDPQLLDFVARNRDALERYCSGYTPVHPEDLPAGYEPGMKLAPVVAVSCSRDEGQPYLPSDDEIEAACRVLDDDWYPEKGHEPCGSETWDRVLAVLLAANRAAQKNDGALALSCARCGKPWEVAHAFGLLCATRAPEMPALELVQRPAATGARELSDELRGAERHPQSVLGAELPEGGRITPLSRIRELSLGLGGETVDLATLAKFSYSWTGDGSGYEELLVELVGGGGSHYSGVFHPGDGCCRGNPCRYCGRAVIE